MFLWYLGLTVVVLVAVFLGMFIHYSEGTLRYMWHGAPLTFRRCKMCGGLGVVLLIGGKYRVIPPELRDRDPETRTFQPPLGNVVRCPRCHAVGHIWGRQQLT